LTATDIDMRAGVSAVSADPQSATASSLGWSVWLAGASSSDPPPLAHGRRSSAFERMALDAAAQACVAWGGPVDSLCSVFATGSGDAPAVDAVLREATQAEPAISPTLFIRSVLGTLAGAWSMRHGNRQPSTTVTAGEFTLGAALLEGVMLCQAEQRSTLVVFVELPAPDALRSLQPHLAERSVAIVLAPSRGDPSWTEWNVRVDRPPGSTRTSTPDEACAALRCVDGMSTWIAASPHLALHLSSVARSRHPNSAPIAVAASGDGPGGCAMAVTR
jgi:hypothetical protein